MEPDDLFNSDEAGSGGPFEMLARCGLLAVEVGAPANAYMESLRRLASMLEGADELTRAAMRSEVVAFLKSRAIQSPARIVDAALNREKPSEDSERLQGRPLVLSESVPWPDRVDGALLLDALVAVLLKYLILPPGASEAIALWVLHTHCIAVLFLSPYLSVVSPMMRCGKSRLLEILVYLVRKALPGSGISAAALYRSVERHEPTLIIDEGDASVRGNEDLRGILNAGHTRLLAYVLRCVGEDNEPRQFSVFGPKVIASIGRLAQTIHDRSIEIRMRRRKRTERVARLRRDHLAAELAPLARMAARWAADNKQTIGDLDPSIPDELDDRAQDNWRPLLSIADLAGNDWPERARKAALLLSGTSQGTDEGVLVRLLADIRRLFREQGTDRLASAAIVKVLGEMEDAPWPEWKNGKPLTATQLARLLREIDIRPKGIRIGDQTPNGYNLEAFEDAWERYLPSEGPVSDPPQGQQPNKDAEKCDSRKVHTDPYVEGADSVGNPRHTCVVDPVEDQETPLRENDIPALAPCHVCRGRIFWRSLDGELRCGECDPPVAEGLLKEWVTFLPSQDVDPDGFEERLV